VALVALVEENGGPVVIGGARYIVVQSGKAEVAFALIDEYQGHGIGRALLHHLAAIASHAGMEELIAEVLPDNIPMLKVFEKSGFPMRTKREAQMVHVSLRLTDHRSECRRNAGGACSASVGGGRLADSEQFRCRPRPLKATRTTLVRGPPPWSSDHLVRACE
jgi:N-acetylglutamate synthase-like GNAT family acetyltransferase